MNETLFSQIQRLFERTYAQVGINLEDCLIDRTRCTQLSILAGRSARELSELARTFLRRAGDELYVGIYYSRWLIEQLEQHDPRAGNRILSSIRGKYIIPLAISFGLFGQVLILESNRRFPRSHNCRLVCAAVHQRENSLSFRTVIQRTEASDFIEAAHSI